MPAFEWWWIAAGLGLFGLIIAFIPAQGRGWPFLFLLPMILISAYSLFVVPSTDNEFAAFLKQDAIFQALFAVRFACAILMVALATGRRFVAFVLAAAVLLADPVLFNFSACTIGAPLCR